MLRGVMHKFRMNRGGAVGAMAGELRRMVPICSACNGNIESHKFAVIGATVIGHQEKPRVTQFFGHFKRHEWNKLHQFNDWQSDRDALVAYSIACPNGGGMVVAIRSPFELYDTDELYVRETVTADEQSAIAKLVPANDWYLLKEG